MISYRSNQVNLISDYILDSYSFASTTQQRDNTEDFYYFDSTTGIYHLGSEGLIFDLISQRFPTVRSHSTIWAIIDKIQRLSIVTDNFDNLQYTCYLNGVYDHKQDKLYPHSHRYFLTHQINQNYIQDNTSSLTLTLNIKRLEMLNYID
jgi:hypothetical protein